MGVAHYHEFPPAFFLVWGKPPVIIENHNGRCSSAKKTIMKAFDIFSSVFSCGIFGHFSKFVEYILNILEVKRNNCVIYDISCLWWTKLFNLFCVSLLFVFVVVQNLPNCTDGSPPHVCHRFPKFLIFSVFVPCWDHLINGGQSCHCLHIILPVGS